ncbi:MAG: aldo/keto reductase [Aeromicrobium sp.]
MTLPTRRLGSTDLELTTVGFGSWSTGGGDWAFALGSQDDDDSVAAIRHALEQGVNWIDTAPVYGLGHAEVVVGEAIRDIPEGERPIISTKCGLTWDDNDRNAFPARILSRDAIRRECDASLQRLGVERIDLYQFHWPAEDGTPVEESWAAMLELVQEGKVRVPGVSNFDVGMLEACEGIGHVGSLQPPFSMIDRGVAAAELPWCASHDTGAIVYSPMQSGLLSGRFTAERAAALASDDIRAHTPPFQEPQLSANLALVEALRPIAARHEVSVAAVSIAWTTSWPGVTAAIVGARSPEQVDGWLAAASLELTTEDLADITAAIEATGAGTGPVTPVSA